VSSARQATGVPNIGPRQRRLRLLGGLAWAVAGSLLLVAAQGLDLPRAWRLLAFPPCWLAALGVLQHREKT